MASQLNHLSLEKDQMGFCLSEYERLAEEHKEMDYENEQDAMNVDDARPVLSEDSILTEQISDAPPSRQLIVEM